MKEDNIRRLADLVGKSVTIKANALEFAQIVCEVMDAEGIINKDSAMFCLLDRGQMKARIAARDWADTEASWEAMKRAREYISIAVRLARVGE